MKFWLILLCQGFSCLLLIDAQFITLDVPLNHISESSQSEFTTQNAKKYMFVTFFKANFFRAHQYCRYNNMELMTVDSKEEEAFFLNLLNGKDFEHKSAKHFWTSGTDLGDEGKFFYLSNGRDVGQLSWAQNEPNNARKADSNETENCIAFTMTENLKFYRLFDRFCSLQFNFVCQTFQITPLNESG